MADRPATRSLQALVLVMTVIGTMLIFASPASAHGVCPNGKAIDDWKDPASNSVKGQGIYRCDSSHAKMVVTVTLQKKCVEGTTCSDAPNWTDTRYSNSNTCKTATDCQKTVTGPTCSGNLNHFWRAKATLKVYNSSGTLTHTSGPDYSQYPYAQCV